MAIVCEVYTGADGLVKSVKVKPKSSYFARPVNKLVFLECSSQVN